MLIEEETEEPATTSETIQDLVQKYIAHTANTDFETDEQYLCTGKDIATALIMKMHSEGLESEDSKIAYALVKAHNKMQKEDFEKRFGEQSD